jgi:hypothetical protein
MDKRKLLAVAALSALCVAAYWLGTNRPASEAEPKEQIVDGLAVETASLHVGEVWEDADFTWRLPLENRTGSAISVLEFAVSCICLSVEPKSLTIPAGKTEHILENWI